MGFADDMKSMSTKDVSMAVKKRLLYRQGIPWNESQGEPIWALLGSAFRTWRDNPEQLKAFETGIKETLYQSIQEKQWEAVQATTELLLGLTVQSKPWEPGDLHSWLFDSWLASVPDSREQARAMGELLQLAKHANRLKAGWVSDQFKLTVNRMVSNSGKSAEQLPWMGALWEQIVSELATKLQPWPWFDLFRALMSVKDQVMRQRKLDVLLSDARENIRNDVGEIFNAVDLYGLIDIDFRNRRTVVLMRICLQWKSIKPDIEQYIQNRLKPDTGQIQGESFAAFKEPSSDEENVPLLGNRYSERVNV